MNLNGSNRSSCRAGLRPGSSPRHPASSPASRHSGPAQQQAQPTPNQGEEPDPLKRERTDKEKFEAKKALRQELKGAYKTWLNQDVA